MRNLSNPTWIKTRGLLFLFLGLLSSSLLFLDHPTAKNAALPAITIWAFCRFYYFAFYVLERYVDPSLRFSSLLSLLRHVSAKRRT